MMEAIIAVTPSETIKCVPIELAGLSNSVVDHARKFADGRTKMIEDSKRPEPKYKGFAHGVRTMVREEGYRGVYRGVGPVVCSIRVTVSYKTDRPDVEARRKLRCPILFLFHIEAVGPGQCQCWRSATWLDDLWDRIHGGDRHCL